MKTFLLIFIPVIIVVVSAFIFLSQSFSPGNGVPPVLDNNNNRQPTTSEPLPASEPIVSSAGKTSDSLGWLGGRGTLKPGVQLELSSVQIVIYDPKTMKELGRTYLNHDGSYKIPVTAGEYLINLAEGYGSSENLPKICYVGVGENITNCSFRLGNE